MPRAIARACYHAGPARALAWPAKEKALTPRTLWLCCCLAGLTAVPAWGAPTATGSSKPATTAPAPAPDLSTYDADALRPIARQLYGIVADLRAKLAAAAREIESL